jgi:hypothetical protein
MAAPGPLGLIVLADLILRPAWSRRYFKISTRSGASPQDAAVFPGPETFAETGLDANMYRPIADRLVNMGLAEWHTAFGVKITTYGLGVADDPESLDRLLPAT